MNWRLYCTAEWKAKKQASVVSTNPIYRCEELEVDSGSVYDEIGTESQYDELDDVIGDETEDDDGKPQLPNPRPELYLELIADDMEPGDKEAKDEEPQLSQQQEQRSKANNEYV